MNCCIGYIRVSTQKQGKSGLGMEAQQAAIEQFASSNGISIRKVFVEVESGKKADRPELQKALNLAKRTGCTLLIAKLDRLSRNAAFLNQLMDAGVQITACDMPEANRMILGMMAQLAQWEAEKISERTKEALQAVKARGVKLGAHRPEWQDQVREKFVESLPEARIASLETRQRKAAEHLSEVGQRIHDLRQSGLSLRFIAQTLNDEGELTPSRGGSWSANQVRRICQKMLASG